MAKVKILYVEDESFLGKIVKESLETRGYEIFMEEDGGKAVMLFNLCKPDICVLDIMLPNKDGFQIAEEIRTINEKVPILFLTAKSQTEDLVKGFKLGGNDYIRKPFSMEELIVRLENILKYTGNESKSADKKDVINIGKYTFHIPRQVLSAKNNEQKLSFREAELLKVLYQNREKIIDRRDILNLLWGNDNFFNSRNLDVYITKLRGYLKADPSVEILTIKGIGYRFLIG
ncbi:MAG: two component transcriptional regulator, winged helix family [Chitinophagaceae bacterium]|nr:two component transcriptional regulator, winged helix family [Chitinophagaceae bacterium]